LSLTLAYPSRGVSPLVLTSIRKPRLHSSSALSASQAALAGWFQSLGVRASGFSIVALMSLAPACRFLYIIMMYVIEPPMLI
jgi:Trk-type K+ transport system membrane component